MKVVMTDLRAKQAELKAVMDKLAALDADLQVGCHILGVTRGRNKLSAWACKETGLTKISPFMHI